MLLHFIISPALRVFTLAAASPTVRSTSAPSVTLDYGTFQGFDSAGNTESFLGVPFAQPPLGQLRFNNPIPPQPFSGVKNATWYGNACPQQPLLGPNEILPNNPGLSGASLYLGELQPQGVVAASEDCLYLNVVRPAGVSVGADLPVVVWIYGGGFENGDASAYNGTQIVSRSVGLKSPVIYVSFNYRLNAFGFLGGKEISAAGLGNFGLHDQRFALQWVQKYIGLFGGNPGQVVLWGQSAGSVSAMLHMVAYDGQLDGLFQAAVMISGSAAPMHDITAQLAQDNYDFLVEQTGCTTSNDTLDCLRQAPYQSILDAVLQTTPLLSYQAINTTWGPLVDGVFLKQSIRHTNDQFLDYIQTMLDVYIFPWALLTDYTPLDSSLVPPTTRSTGSASSTPDDPILVSLEFCFSLTLMIICLYWKGSPYDVGTNDTLSQQYKRISSFQGDFYFQVPRRYALRYLSQTQDVWSYLWKRNKFVPGIGSFHESDLQEFYDLTGTSRLGGHRRTQYVTCLILNFAYTLDPNVPPSGDRSGAAPSLLCNISWPRYQLSSLQLLTFEDPNVLTFTTDTYRAEAMVFLDAMQDQMSL
ncbi:Alpha/Beta hydrolase protein [Lanmaoa asiatica]|nr:Alpha/Beta hydrolase protein [Lanmaoa asiatica]